MAVLNIETEIQKELRDGATWADQALNLLYALIWGIGTWLSVSTVMTGLVLIAIVAGGEANQFDSVAGLFEAFNVIVIGVFSIGALVVLLFGIPKKNRNVFRDVACNRVERQRAIYYQAELVESVLIRHGLITEQDASQAKAEREADQ